MAIQLRSQHVTNMYTPIELVTTNMAYAGIGGAGGVTDHGYLHGLSDNDHPQYFLASRSTLFMTSANMSNYQLTANNSLSLGTAATQSFIHTSNSSNFIAKSQSGVFALTNHTHTGLGGAASDHSHGNVSIDSVSGTLLDVHSASNGMTVFVPNYLTTAYGAGIKGSGSYTQNTGTIEFANGNGVTFGLSENGVMTASIPAIGGAQTGISGIAGSAASTVTAGTIQFGNANGISFGLNSNTMTASYTVPGVTVFSNSNNIEFGLSGSTITALGNFVQTTQTQNVHNVSLSGNTAGTMTQISSGTLTLAGGNNITLSQSGNKVSIIGAQGGNYVNVGGNTSGTTADISSGTMTLAGGNNITLSQNGNGITISGAAQGGVQTGISGIGGSNTTFTSGSVIWSGQNNITIGTFATSDSQYIRLSVGNYLLTAAQSDHIHGSNISFGNTTNSTESVVRATSASNGLTMVIPKYITTAALSQNTSNYAGISTGSQSTAGTDVKLTLNTAGLNIGMPKYITDAGVHTHGSNLNLSLDNLSGSASSASNGLTISLTGYPATSFVNVSDQGSLYFGGGSNITWGSSVDGMSTSIMATAGGGTGGGAGFAMQFSGNVSGTTTEVSSGTVRLVGGNNITLSQAGSIVTISAANSVQNDWSTSASTGTAISVVTGGVNLLYVPPFLTTATGLVNTGFTTTATNGTVVLGTLNSLGLKLAVPPYVTAGGGGGAMSISAGVSSASLASMVFSNSNNISFGLNGSTITAAAPTGTVSFIDGNGITWGTSSGSVSNITAVTASVVGGTHTHSQYVNVSETGSVYFSNANGVTFGTTVSSNSTTVSGSIANYLTTAAASNHSHTEYAGILSTGITGGSATINSSQVLLNFPSGNIFFADSNGHTFSSSVSGVSTTIYIVT